jgi:hypothetical protein
MAGRKSLLTQAVHDEFIRLVRIGNFIEPAAIGAGVSQRSVYNWLERGEHDEAAGVSPNRSAYLRFLLAYREADATSERQLYAVIRQEAVQDWHAAAWILERKYRFRWGRSSQPAFVEQAKEIEAVDDKMMALEDPDVRNAVLEAQHLVQSRLDGKP